MKNFIVALIGSLCVTTANANPELKDCSNKAMFSKQVSNAKYSGMSLQEVQEAIKTVLKRSEYAHMSAKEKAELEVQAVIAYHNRKAPDQIFDEVLNNCMKGIGES